MLGIDCGTAVNHQPEFAAHTITPSGEQAIRDRALAMAYTVIDMGAKRLGPAVNRRHPSSVRPTIAVRIVAGTADGALEQVKQ